jgi:hypothetical protein
MRYKIVTHFIYNDCFSHRCEVKTNELLKAYEIAKAFVIGSKSCLLSIWAKGDRKKLPNFCKQFNISDLEKNSALYDIQSFQDWILDIKKQIQR